ncbi:MAG: hypothetical protein RL609_1536 [Bacteroidota bacterium]|jgi:hypothetical protein
MKVLIKNISQFTIALFLLVFVAFSILAFQSKWITATNIRYKPTCNGKLAERIKEANQCRNIDILFLGSSHCYRGFDTRIFKSHDLLGFNLGSSSQTPMQSALLLDRYVDFMKPQLVVLEIFPDLYDGNGLESTLDFISNIGPSSVTHQMLIETHDISAYNTYGYGLIKNLWLGPDIIQCDTALEQYVAGGFVEKKKFITTTFQGSSIPLSWKDSQLKSFNRIQEICNQRKIPLVYVLAPMTTAYYAQYPNIDHWISSIEQDGFKVYNFNPIGKHYSESHFYDAHHLNQKGVEIFNQELITIIKKDFPL